MKKTTPLTLALAALAVVALAPPAASRTEAAPAAAVGTWTRTVTAADVARRGPVATGQWRLELKQTGAMRLFNGPGSRPVVTGKLTAGTAGTLKMLDLVVTGGGRCKEQPTYRWSLSAGRLALSTTADKCPGRATVLVGTWRRA